MSERSRVMPADNPMPSSTPAPYPPVPTPHRMGMEDPAVVGEVHPSAAEHHDAPVDASINAVVGEKVILNGSVYDMGEHPSPLYAWVLVPPAGVTALLTSPDKVSPSFVADVPGDYVASLQTPYGVAHVTIHVVEKPKE